MLGSKTRHSEVSPEELARKWSIGLDKTLETLKVTTQFGVRKGVHPLTRRYRVDHLCLSRRRLSTRFYTDTLFSKYKSYDGNTCSQIYTNGKFYWLDPVAL